MRRLASSPKAARRSSAPPTGWKRSRSASNRASRARTNASPPCSPSSWTPPARWPTATRLELVRRALQAVAGSLRPEDGICIVGFAGQAELLLPRTSGRQQQRILDAINTLSPGGGTNVEAGLMLGYRLADEAYSPDAVNRVILCSDGVANIGAQGPDEMLKMVQIFAARGIDLATVGFGQGEYNDKMMQRLADNGKGACYFVDTAAETEKVFGEQLPAHLRRPGARREGADRVQPRGDRALPAAGL